MTYPHNYTSPLNKCVIRVDDQWYDCTTWRHSHPGGAQICDQFHNADATDVFYSLHSEEAIQKLRRMKGKPVDAKDLKRNKISEDFQNWRKELEKEGWFERIWLIDFCKHILPMLSFYVIGTMISGSHPILATILIGFAMQQFGWIGHDYVHARGRVADVLRWTGSFTNGFSADWWSQKHNTHHSFPNRKEFDSDIHNEPILHLWFPDANSDVWYRKYQHYYYLVAFSFLYASWRLQSIQFVLGSKNWGERAAIAINYMWLACLPWKVAVGSILLAGFMVAVVVTANHQTEPLIEPKAEYNFIADQYTTTRGVATTWISEYFFGGMQYQLEHHLFPTMPRYYYPSLRPLVRKFAQEHDLRCDVSSVWETLSLNYKVMKQFAQENPVKKH